ncbi:MAG TPA: CocE/NonD family hydrolase [Bryobacteraceae bacterium]|nr:CocE/NonD family hydrolase [Bryobacteraceae bacterium]
MKLGRGVGFGVGVSFCVLAGVRAGAADAVQQDRVRVAMRDGIKLAADVYYVPGPGKLPVILVRTPYNKGKKLSRGHRAFVDAGYAVVIQDVRGRYESDGNFDPLHQEYRDGDDTLSWIAKQPWSNGKVGMIGGSYVGIVQWKAALTGNPALKAIFPVVSGYDDYRDRFYSTGGAMKAGNRLLWISGNMKAPGFTPPKFDLFVRSLPIKDADRAATGHTIRMYQNAMEHPTYDSFWKSISTREHIADVKVPVFSAGGWYDNFVQSDLEAFSALRKLGRDAHTLIGPWAHNMSVPFDGFSFGPDASAPILRLQLDWFDHHLKGGGARAQFAPLRIFVMGRNKWRDEREWPLARALPTPYYLSKGTLHTRAPRRHHTDKFSYNPADPVPTHGGNTCCNPKIFAWGPMDQRNVEKRKDVLVYTGPELKQDTEVTGPIKVVLYVSTSARDTDFTAKLVDVHPDGRAINLTDGILRLRYREGLETAVLAEPGKTYGVTIDAGVTSNVFLAGHRIRLEISSSNFPRFDRNFNTGKANNFESKGVVAEQTIYSGRDVASHILLPVVR